MAVRAEYYNDYPDGFLQEFTEPVTFELIGVKPDPENEGQFIIPFSKNVPATSRVQFEGQDVHIAHITSVKPDGTAVFGSKELRFGVIAGGFRKRLDPKKAKDVALFRYLNHCHWNADSPYVEDKRACIIRRFDLQQITEESRNSRQMRTIAIKAIDDLADDRLIPVFAKVGKGQYHNLSEAELRDRLEEIAEKDPKTIIEALNIKFEPRHKVAKEDVPSVTVSDFKAPEELVEAALKAAKIKMVPAAKEYRTSDGKSIFKFVTGNGTGKEQLISAVETDEQLRKILLELVS